MELPALANPKRAGTAPVMRPTAGPRDRTLPSTQEGRRLKAGHCEDAACYYRDTCESGSVEDSITQKGGIS